MAKQSYQRGHNHNTQRNIIIVIDTLRVEDRSRKREKVG
jgi:hypothetical protein